VYCVADSKSTILPLTLSGRPQDLCARLLAAGPAALLESSKAMPGLSGWSYLAGPPAALLETDAHGTWLRDAQGQVLQRWADPFDALREVLARSAAPATGRPAGLDFAGGWLGWLGYDLARHVERLPVHAAADPDLPALRLQLCDQVLAYEHATQRWYDARLQLPGLLPPRDEVHAATLARAAGPMPAATQFRAGEMRSRTPAPRYLQQVREVLALIAQGDIFQANLSHRLEGDFEGDPFALYRRLTALNPAPFSAYLPLPDGAIASVSPERFLRLDGREVSARPIKGTRGRGADAQADAQQRAALAASPKDRAENLMIVDLMRNDLGRVAQVGSVRVDGLFEIEAHPSVFQMVSTVRARLRDGAGTAELLRACWPPGSMTGAPKVRAMEIIEAIEPLRRGPYAGAIGYFDAAGGMDLSVVIRTALVHGRRVMVQVGGAVVADSDPREELDETLAKGRLLLHALREGSTLPLQ
jgi:para-aminobenzoate synthetase component 1